MSLRPFSRTQGFTLVELMVAIAVMALLALVSWRGLDSMVRAQESIRARNEQQMVLQTVIAQWNADLEALMPLEYAQAIDWDGQVLRMTRKSSAAVDDGAVVVAWAQPLGRAAPPRNRAAAPGPMAPVLLPGQCLEQSAVQRLGQHHRHAEPALGRDQQQRPAAHDS
jgi:prepilin-type N-terminal cleavage/methylation domain-containing protein